VRLPERGRIGIFNRSWYEEVLVVRVHPQYLERQRLPGASNSRQFWLERFHSIREHELHLARNGTVIIKFWLNVSRDEQRARFLERIDEPEKNWKFAPGDVRERAHWDTYMRAYQDALRETSKPWAPWYAIPADSKAWMRTCVAEIIVATLRDLKLEYPSVDEAERTKLTEMRALLDSEDD
jgi:polyphosphate kinase 2 (PPK2 family)